MTARTWLAKGRNLVGSAYHRTVGEVIQRRRSRAYVRQQGDQAARPPMAPPQARPGRETRPAPGRSAREVAGRPARTSRTRTPRGSR